MAFRMERSSLKERGHALLVTDRKVTRFRRLIDSHTVVLDSIADLNEKQSGEYILDRQYIEAQIDKVYDRVRQILYDSNVICESDGEKEYAQLARLRQASEDLLKDFPSAKTKRNGLQGEDAVGWEVLALRSMYQALTRFQRESPSSQSPHVQGAPPPQGLTEIAGLTHEKAAAWLCQALPYLPLLPGGYICREGSSLIELFGLNGFLVAEKGVKPLLCAESLRSGDPAIGPLSYLIQGLAESHLHREESRSLYVAGPREKIKPGESPCPRLYVGDVFFLLWLPSPSPFRLLVCSLSVTASENLLYLYGSSGLDRCEIPSPFFSSHEKAPFTTYGYKLSERWIIWATRFSRLQGEERLRLLGNMLGTSLAFRPGSSSKEQWEETLRQILDTFYVPSREYKNGTASSYNGC